MGMKKGIFFTIDAILGTSILILTIVLASSYYISETKTGASDYLSSDLVRTFSSLKVGEIDNEYVQTLIGNNNITKLNNTLLEQIGEFWSEDDLITAQDFAANITKDLLPDKFGIGIWIDDELIYSNEKPISKNLVSSRKLISGIAKEKPIEGYISRTFLSKISEKVAYSHAYFGGYTGEGDIMMNIRLPDEYNSIIEGYMELQVDNSFSLYINGIYSGDYIDTVSGDKRADSWVIDPSYHSNFNAGLNYIKINFSGGNGLIGGGFFRVKSSTNNINFTIEDYDGSRVRKKEYLPGIDGVINIYSSFYVPGDLDEISLYLNYSTNYPIFVSFGNVTVYEGNNTGDIEVNISESDISEKITDYRALSGKTIPLRIGHYSTERNRSRHSDSVVCTDLSSSMDIMDVPPDNEARLDVTKRVEKTFIDYVINLSLENRIGLAGYYSSVKPGTWHSLSNDATSLKDMVESYKTYGTDNSCFACALKEAEAHLNAETPEGKNKAIIIMSDGFADKCWGRAPCAGFDPVEEAIEIACEIHENSDITIYSIGFGVGADNTTLKNMSVDCGGGLFYNASNETRLEEVFKEIADEILTLGFYNQKAVSEGVSSSLSKDSYIGLEYFPDIAPLVYKKIPITVESEPFGNDITTGTISIPENVTVTNAVVTSYSGDEWTEILNVSDTNVFDLSYYDTPYPEIGDPFLVNILPSLLTSGENDIIIKSAKGPYPENETGGSEDDRAIYDILIDSSIDYSGVGSVAEGCNWTITYEDGTILNITIPSDYSGDDECNFEDGVYDPEDAIEAGFYSLLENLDFDGDGLVDIKFDQESLSVESVIIPKVPSLWGPAVIEIRVWE